MPSQGDNDGGPTAHFGAILKGSRPGVHGNCSCSRKFEANQTLKGRIDRLGDSNRTMNMETLTCKGMEYEGGPF